MEKKKILISLWLMINSVSVSAVSFVPENKVQAALLRLNMDGTSELLCYQELKVSYSPAIKI